MGAIAQPGPDRVREPGRSRRRSRRPAGLIAVAGAVTVFLYAPLLVVVLFAFNSRRSLATFGEPSLRWFDELLDDADMLASIRVSVVIAAVTTVVALILGVLIAIGLERLRGRVSTIGTGLLSLTLVTPEVALAFAFLLTFTTMQIPLSTTTVIAGHITFSVVYVTLVVRGRLTQLSERLEEAAMDLGATRLASVRLVILPQLWPAILGAGMLVFVLSFDDFVVSLFVSGTETPPLPVRIYGMLRTGVTPEVNAVAVVMLAASVTIGAVGFWLTRRQRGFGEQIAKEAR